MTMLTILAGARHQDVYSLLLEGLQGPLSGLPIDVNGAFRGHLRTAAEHLAQLGLSTDILAKFQQVGGFLKSREQFGGVVSNNKRLETLMLASASGASLINNAMGGVGLALAPDESMRYLIGAATATLWFRARMVTVAPKCLSTSAGNAKQLRILHLGRFRQSAEMLMMYLSNPQRQVLLPDALPADYTEISALARRGADIQNLDEAFLADMEEATGSWLLRYDYRTPFVRIFDELMRMYGGRY